MKAQGGAGRKGRILFFALAALALQAAVLLAAILLGGDSSPATTGEVQASTDRHGPPGGPPAGPRAAHREDEPIPDEMLYTYDLQDERIVVALSQNVFAARVESAVGEEPAKSTIPGDPGRPQLQFAVSVLASAKAAGPVAVRPGQSVVVNQEVGRDPDTGRPLPIRAAFCGEHLNDEILEPGRTYLFATYHEPGRGVHTLTAQPTGNVPVSGEAEARTLVSAYRTYDGADVDATGKFDGGKPCE